MAFLPSGAPSQCLSKVDIRRSDVKELYVKSLGDISDVTSSNTWDKFYRPGTVSVRFCGRVLGAHATASVERCCKPKDACGMHLGRPSPFKTHRQIKTGGTVRREVASTVSSPRYAAAMRLRFGHSLDPLTQTAVGK